MIVILPGFQTIERERASVPVCRLAYLDSSLDLGVVRCRRCLYFSVLVLGGRSNGVLAGRPVVVVVLRRVTFAAVGNSLLPLTAAAAAFLEAVGEVAGGVVIGPRNARRIAEREECEEIGKCSVKLKREYGAAETKLAR